jgi:hypothetical protein
MEALILILDMGGVWYLCWRLFRQREREAADLGLLRYDDECQP